MHVTRFNLSTCISEAWIAHGFNHKEESWSLMDAYVWRVCSDCAPYRHSMSVENFTFFYCLPSFLRAIQA